MGHVRTWPAIGWALAPAFLALSVTAAPAPVHLTCETAQGLSQAPARLLCDALEDQLKQAQPDRPVLRDTAASPDALTLVLTVTQVLPQQITAQLAWQDGTARGTTPPLSLSAMDTETLRSQMYDRLVRALMAQAGIVN